MRILRPEEIHLLRLGMPVIPANGGSSKSSSDTSSTNNTTNNVHSEDKRNVASEQAVSVSGSGNIIDRSSVTNSSTSFSDASNRSSNFNDESNRSTNFYDLSDRSVTNTVTDFGALGRALETVGTVATKAIGTSEELGLGAIDSLNKTGANSVLLALKAFENSEKSSANALTSSREALGFAKDAITETRSAFAEAKDGGQNKTLLLVAAAVIGAVGLAFAFRN